MSRSDRKIRVLYAMDSLGVGGAEQLIYTLARSLPKERFHVVVCTFFSRGAPEPIADEIRALGIRVEQFTMTRWRDWHTMRRFLVLLDEERIDIVHGHMVPADFWSCLLAKIGRRLKTIHTKHDFLPRPGRANRFQRWILERMLSDRIVAISEVVENHLVEERGVRRRRIVRIPDPVDTARFHPGVSGAAVRRELGIPPEALVIGNTSRFEKQKGYNLFLEVAGLIAPHHKQVYFLAVGHGLERDAMEAYVRETGLTDQVIVTGPRRDIPEVVAAMDIFLFTSLWGEGFGIVLIEAMASGKAMVAVNIGPLRELIEDGLSGYLPAPAEWSAGTDRVDAEPLAERLSWLINHPNERKKLGEAAHRRAAELYSTSAVNRQTERVYREILGWTA